MSGSAASRPSCSSCPCCACSPPRVPGSPASSGCPSTPTRTEWLAPPRRLGEHAEDAGPATFGVEHLAHLVGAVAEPVEIPVLELEPGAVRAFGVEASLDLCVDVGIGREIGVDLPVEHDPVGRVPHEHATPLLLADGRGGVPAAALSWLHDGLHE